MALVRGEQELVRRDGLRERDRVGERVLEARDLVGVDARVAQVLLQPAGRVPARAVGELLARELAQRGQQPAELEPRRRARERGRVRVRERRAEARGDAVGPRSARERVVEPEVERRDVPQLDAGTACLLYTSPSPRD